MFNVTVTCRLCKYKNDPTQQLGRPFHLRRGQSFIERQLPFLFHNNSSSSPEDAIRFHLLSNRCHSTWPVVTQCIQKDILTYSYKQPLTQLHIKITPLCIRAFPTYCSHCMCSYASWLAFQRMYFLATVGTLTCKIVSINTIRTQQKVFFKICYLQKCFLKYSSRKRKINVLSKTMQNCNIQKKQVNVSQ